MLNQILTLLGKELKLDSGSNSSIPGIVLFVFSCVFMVYLANNLVEGQTLSDSSNWQMVYWLIVLFGSISAVNRNIMEESHSRMLYYRSLVPSSAFIVSKLVYNGLIATLTAFVAFALLFFLVEPKSLLIGRFFLCLSLGAVGLSILYTLVASLTFSVSRNATLATILGIPLTIPLINLIVNASSLCNLEAAPVSFRNAVLLLLLLDCILVLLSMILFPYIWRD